MAASLLRIASLALAATGGAALHFGPAPLPRGIAASSASKNSPFPQFSLAPADPKAAAAGVLCALLLAFSPVSEAQAKSSGGRVGGRVSSSSVRSAPTQSRTTNVYVAPAPTVIAPVPSYGYGYGYGYAPSPGLMGLSVGLDIVGMISREQQRQAYLEQQLRMQREIGADQARIADLQRELSQQNAKIDQLRAQQSSQQPAMQP